MRPVPVGGRSLAILLLSTLLLVVFQLSSSRSSVYQAAASISTSAPSTLEITSKLIRTNDIRHANKPTAGKLRQSPENQLTPVILLPGDGGSRLQAKLNRRDVLHHYCERRSNDWFDLYLSLSNLVPFALDCWLDNMKLVYNSTTRRTENAPGVETRVYGFGTTESVEYVDPARVMGTSYFDTLVKQLVAFGYERNKNIYGAPYDFRKAPNELEDYFFELRNLIEKAYVDNGNERVSFLCHSMGCLHGLYFLNNISQRWKDKYIRSLISLAGVWGGSVKAMKAFASGDNFGVVVVPSLSLREDVRTFTSSAFLMPHKDIWPEDAILMKNRDKSYTINDYKEFFEDINYPLGYQMWLDVRNLTSPSNAPGVEVHCLHGNKVTTIETLHYEVGKFPEAKPRVSYGDGDGTVNLISLQACIGWAAKQKEPLYYKNFTSVDHMTILTDGKVLNYIGEALTKKQL